MKINLVSNIGECCELRPIQWLLLSLQVLLLLCLTHHPLLAQAAPGVTLTTLYTFTGLDGSKPNGGLIQGMDGNFYGTTSEGGAGKSGTIFRVTRGGTLTTLYQFSTANNFHQNSDGANPQGNLILAKDGSFYGTTFYGGMTGTGTIFSITPEGVFSLIHYFSFVATDGSYPNGGIIQGSDGDFYGVARSGGGFGNGDIFRYSPSALYNALYTVFSFDLTGADGTDPYGSLVQGIDGNFYGSTESGGSANYGTIFRLTPSGTLTTLYDFTSGRQPNGNLIQGSDGNFYGTTRLSYPLGSGTVFRISPSGVLTTLHTFSDSNINLKNSDGVFPVGGLVQGSDGNFYGTTQYGGPSGVGTVFRITPSGVFTTLYSFGQPDAKGNIDAATPAGNLVQGSDGSFYGATSNGGPSNFGTLFKLTFLEYPLLCPCFVSTSTPTLTPIFSGTTLRRARSAHG